MIELKLKFGAEDPGRVVTAHVGKYYSCPRCKKNNTLIVIHRRDGTCKCQHCKDGRIYKQPYTETSSVAESERKAN